MPLEQRSGFYRGIVVDSNDPEGLQRLRAQVPQLFGTAVTDWAWPAVPIAVGVAVPAQGDNVWITFEAGDPERPVWAGVWITTRPGGAAPNPNFGGVVAETSYGQAPSNGVNQTLARSDHTHGSPSLTNSAPTTQAFSDAAAVGTAVTPARADHRHGMMSDPVIPHLAAGDPHPQYSTDADMAAEAAARIAGDSAASTARATLEDEIRVLLWMTRVS